MAADVEQHQHAAVEQERIRRELELGRQIQHDMLPQGPLRLGLTEIKGVSVPAREVGGDFFNYFALTDGRIALLVGDVSGKGVGAALLMANIQASLRTRLALGQDLAALAREIDVDIEANTPGPGLRDAVRRHPRSRRRACCATSTPATTRSTSCARPERSSTCRRRACRSACWPAAATPKRACSSTAGDLLFFYTDGCVEAENEAGEMFGAERLEALLVVGHRRRRSAGARRAVVPSSSAARASRSTTRR